MLVNQDLIHGKVSSKEIADRIEAAEALRDTFGQLPDKNEAWQDLLTLMQDRDSNVRYIAMDALGCAFGLTPDKNEAWQDLLRFTHSKDGKENKSSKNPIDAFNNSLIKSQSVMICSG